MSNSDSPVGTYYHDDDGYIQGPGAEINRLRFRDFKCGADFMNFGFSQSQAALDAEKAKVEMLVNVLKYYGDKKNWTDFDCQEMERHWGLNRPGTGGHYTQQGIIRFSPTIVPWMLAEEVLASVLTDTSTGEPNTQGGKG